MPESEFSITLEKDNYAAGDTAKGVIKISDSEKLRKARKIEFFANGQETTRISVTSGTGKQRKHHTYKSSNDFFSEDLTGLIRNKTGDMPFSFKIPADALPSYRGQYACVSYWLSVKADIPMAPDVEEKVPFSVYVPRDVISQDKKNPLEVYDSDKLLGVKLERGIYSPANTIKGELAINDKIKDGIKKIRVEIKGFEYAAAQNFKKEILIGEHCFELKKKESLQQFAVTLPGEMLQSYSGKYSKFYWIFNVKFDIPWKGDAIASVEIQIV